MLDHALPKTPFHILNPKPLVDSAEFSVETARKEKRIATQPVGTNKNLSIHQQFLAKYCDRHRKSLTSP